MKRLLISILPCIALLLGPVPKPVVADNCLYIVHEWSNFDPTTSGLVWNPNPPGSWRWAWRGFYDYDVGCDPNGGTYGCCFRSHVELWIWDPADQDRDYVGESNESMASLPCNSIGQAGTQKVEVFNLAFNTKYQIRRWLYGGCGNKITASGPEVVTIDVPGPPGGSGPP